MARFRFVFRFNWGNVAGFSEEYFLNAIEGDPIAGLTVAASQVGTARAQFMSRNCTVIDARVNDVLTPDTVIPIGLNIQGTRGTISGAGADTGPEPVMAAARIKAGGGGGKNRVLHFRGLADADVRDAVLSPSTVVIARINTFMNLLIGDWNAATQKSLFGVTNNIVSIDGATRTVTTLATDPLFPPLGSLVAVQTNVAGGGPRINTLGVVQSRDDPNHKFVLNSWSHGDSVGGTTRVVAYSYAAWTSTSFYSPNYIVYKKTGRAFSPFRGRASPRV